MPRAAVVHLKLRAGSTFPAPVCTVTPGFWINKANTQQDQPVQQGQTLCFILVEFTFTKGAEVEFTFTKGAEVRDAQDYIQQDNKL